MLTPIRIPDILVRERTYASFTLRLLWSEAPLLLLGAVGLGVASVPAWFIWVNLGHVPVVSLLALLGPMPVWTALCYPLGRAATGRPARFGDFGKALWLGYARVLLAGLPFLTALNLWVAATSLLAAQPPLWVAAGVTANFGVAVALGMATLFALPTLVLFDLPAPRAWLYGLALAFRWPLVSLGLLALAFLLGLGARALGLAGWVLWPMALLPFNVTAVLLLMRRGYERERAQKELSPP